MASVTGRTAEAIDEMFNDMVVSVRVSSTGRLLYKTKGGAETDGGAVVAPTVAVDKCYPVGSIYISNTPTNPAGTLGVGVWARTGQGRTLIGQSPTDTDFDAPEEIGGSKTHTVSLEQMPTHAHTMAHDHVFRISYDRQTTPTTGGGGDRINIIDVDTTSNDIDKAGRTDGSSAANTGNRGNGEPVNHMNPYVVVYFWKRTA